MTPGVICGYRIVQHIYKYKKIMTRHEKYEAEKKNKSTIGVVNFIEINPVGK
jgi:ribosomal protein S17